MYQCCWCWIVSKRYTEVCRWCGAECVVMVTEEDYERNGKTQQNGGKQAIYQFLYHSM